MKSQPLGSQHSGAVALNIQAIVPGRVAPLAQKEGNGHSTITTASAPAATVLNATMLNATIAGADMTRDGAQGLRGTSATLVVTTNVEDLFAPKLAALNVAITCKILPMLAPRLVRQDPSFSPLAMSQHPLNHDENLAAKGIALGAPALHEI